MQKTILHRLFPTGEPSTGQLLGVPVKRPVPPPTDDEPIAVGPRPSRLSVFGATPSFATLPLR